ncbi:MAG TPA: cation-translocating P-type ATPase [Polyangiales bacterium]|nr:cation-translocating P-type ATPase [Polyangiales bacterium]
MNEHPPASMELPEHIETPAPGSGGSRTGLTAAEARRRALADGSNEIRREQGVTPWSILLRQFQGAMIWLLVAAAGISFLVGESLDAIAILVIVVLNALVGFFQEYRSERAVQALQAMTAPRARVLRDGRAVTVPAAEVVKGDLLLLEAGDVVAADAQLIEAHVLSVIEAALTGESLPSEKSLVAAPPDAPLAERTDRVFMGTAVATGTGMAEVTAIGMATELGKIAHLLATTTEQTTPLQRQLERVGRGLLVLCVATVGLVALVSMLHGQPWMELLMSSVSLAVAAVPEGLAATVTVALALGVQRMAARHVLIRRLPSVETLGSTTVICTDKTGTLTTGEMRVREVWGAEHGRVVEAAAACCDAEIGADGRGGTGDPTEIAILLAAAQRGIDRAQIERDRPRVDVHPFDSDRKRMSIFRADGHLYLKGAVESVVPLCGQETAGALDAAAEMASRGLRVLAVATGPNNQESGLALHGLIGIADPPRTEAIEAVREARAAGIRTVMITGDHPMTARAIALELGIVQPHEDWRERVHARATPQQKLEIVRSWKARGEIVAMTGDGVNDAPALREAHIGIAMGQAGTEVTREASDMILTDDNFASIVAAVREGRGVYDNIRKTLVYLLAGNTGELLVMLGAAVLALPVPLVPLQILWINLVTDGLPALALVADPPDADVLHRPPQPPNNPMLARPEWTTIVVTGLVQATVTLSVFAWALRARDLTEARNLAFTVLVFGELFRAFAARSRTRPFWRVPLFSNISLLAVIVVSAALQIAIHHIPFTQELFGVGTISAMDCLLSLVLGLLPLAAAELLKAALRQRGAATSTAVTAMKGTSR